MIIASRALGRRAATVPRSQGEITVARGMWRRARTRSGPCRSISRGGPLSSTANCVASPKCSSASSSPFADPVPSIVSDNGSSLSSTPSPTTPSTPQPTSTASMAATAGRNLTYGNPAR